MSDRGTLLEKDIRGLDRLELPLGTTDSLARRLWRSAWPKLAAVAMALVVWELVVLSGWQERFVLPPPYEVFETLGELATTDRFWVAIATTLRRAVIGFSVAMGIGTVVGLAVSQSSVFRRAVGSLITGLQTMPSIAWFPLAILLFGLTETAIFFVVLIGAAPSIANGLINGVDHIPPVLLRAGRMLGARGMTAWRHVVLPAALPSYVGGLKQGWAFAWRSLMAGEILVIIAARPSIGVQLQFARELSDSDGLQAFMIVVLIIGILVDIIFGAVERRLRRNRGLVA
ncbi:MAG: ABC transporter permease [Acidimicrobiia bacterium]|nr:ABC transporter permease [Acidimicrobiia bacterium]